MRVATAVDKTNEDCAVGDGMDGTTETHKNRKREEYWADLVGGGTAAYKMGVLERLLEGGPPAPGGDILDVGAGTSDASNFVRRFVPEARVVRCDYDATVIEAAAEACDDPDVEFRVADIFEVGNWTDQFSIVLFLDMLHEVYSFVGRSDGLDSPIDHGLGQDAVRRALASVSRLVRPGGVIVITDNVLCEYTGNVEVRVDPDVRAAVVRFLEDYPSRQMAVDWEGDRLFIGAHDFCILLTQYNKIKTGQEDRWAVEQLEIHQYMMLSEFATVFDTLGFDLECVVGTPDDAYDEWSSDFEVVAGLEALPLKRVTLVATRR